MFLLSLFFINTGCLLIFRAREEIISADLLMAFNFISSMVWIFSVVGFGYLISHTQLATKYQTQFMSIIIYLPVALLTFGIIALVYKWLSKTKEV